MATRHTFHVLARDGPMERWHQRGALEYWNEKQAPNAYQRLFQAANARLQKFFLEVGARVQHEKTRDWAVDMLFDETIKLDISYDGVQAMGKVLDEGWKSAKRYNLHQFRKDKHMTPLEDQAQWDRNYANVSAFLDSLDSLSTHELLKERLLTSLITAPARPDGITYVKETWEETYEEKKYTIHHHFNCLPGLQ